MIHRHASHVQTFSRHQDRSTCRFFFPSVGGPSIKSTWSMCIVCFKVGCARVDTIFVGSLPRWPYQPYQVFDMNSERVALQRRFPPDDQFVVPHNLLLTMFSPSSVNVVAFDQLRGADHARAYATKYCSKPEKWHLHHLNCEALV